MFRLRVTPGAASDRVLGVEGGTLQLAVKAAARGGQANQALRELLAGWLALDEDRVAIVRGTTARTKWVRVAGMDAATLCHCLARILPRG